MKISACIITFNEEKNIAEAIRSVDWADEILVIDSESTDSTAETARRLGAKVVTQKWLGFSKQKQFAVENAEHEWIFSLDADERISIKLKDEIRHLKQLSDNDLADAYKMPRQSFYMNRKIRYGGWYPDWQTRFFKRRKGSWKKVLIHESIQMENESRIETLAGDILHYSIENAAQHHKMVGERYAPLAARQMFERGRRTSPLKIMTVGSIAFLQTYVLKLGFLDGLPGFCIARFAAHHAFLKHLLLFEIQQNIDGEK